MVTVETPASIGEPQFVDIEDMLVIPVDAAGAWYITVSAVAIATTTYELTVITP